MKGLGMGDKKNKAEQVIVTLPAWMARNGKEELIPSICISTTDNWRQYLDNLSSIDSRPETREWEENPFAAMIPAVACRCILRNKVWGQELRKGETLQKRMATISRKRGETQKWIRLLKILSNYYHLNGHNFEVRAWAGYEWQKEAMAFAVACHYWNDFFTSCMDSVWGWMNSAAKEQKATFKKTLENFLEEGRSFWKWNSPGADVWMDYGNLIFDEGEMKCSVRNFLSCIEQILNTSQKHSFLQIFEKIWSLGKTFAGFGSFASCATEEVTTELIERRRQSEAIEYVEKRADVKVLAANLKAERYKVALQQAKHDAKAEAESHKKETSLREKLGVELKHLQEKYDKLQKNEMENSSKPCDEQITSLLKEHGNTLKEIKDMLRETESANMDTRSAVDRVEMAVRDEGERTRKEAQVQGEATRSRVGDVETLVKKTDAEKKRELDSAEKLVMAFIAMKGALAENAECKKEDRKSKKDVAKCVIADKQLTIGADQFLRLYDGRASRGSSPNWLHDLKEPQTGEDYLKKRKNWEENHKKSGKGRKAKGH